MFNDQNLFTVLTSILLNYYIINRYLDYILIENGDKHEIHINGIKDPIKGNYLPKIEQLNGITFYAEKPENTIIYLGDQIVDNIKVNPPDYMQKSTITIGAIKQ